MSNFESLGYELYNPDKDKEQVWRDCFPDTYSHPDERKFYVGWERAEEDNTDEYENEFAPDECPLCSCELDYASNGWRRCTGLSCPYFDDRGM